MLFDRQNQFSLQQVITATAVSDDYIDLAVIRNIGAGEPLFLNLLVTAAFTDSGSDSTVTTTLITDDNTGFASAAIIRTFDVFAALTPINTRRIYRLEPFTESGIFERYIRLNYTVANGNLTTGAITAFLSLDTQAFRAYASGFVVA